VSEAHGWERFVAAQYQYSLVKRDIEYEFVELCEHEKLSLIPWGPLGGGFLSGKYQRGQRPTDVAEGRIGEAGEGHEESWERRNTARNWAILEVVDAIAQERSATHAQVALSWLRAQPMVGSVILGARTMAQLEDNLGASSLDLGEEELQRLDRVSALPELYPYRMIEAYGRKMPG
jgi:aryl-alcohol dehydrogenase-like predicted oxidoreductase